jgi:hypothetical protein
MRMTRITVLIDVIAGGVRQPGRCVDASAGADRRKKRDRRDPDRHCRWQQGSTPGQSAEARAYRFRSFVDRRAKQEPEATAGPDPSCHLHGGGAVDGGPRRRSDFPEGSPCADREEILIRVANDRSGSSARWLHVEL